MAEVEAGAKTLETITLVHPKNENELLIVELRAEEGGYSVLSNRGERGVDLKEDARSETPIPLDRARVFFDRTVEEAMDQGYEPEYDDDLDDLDLEGLMGGAEAADEPKASSLSGLAALAAAIGDLDGADPKAMLERMDPSNDADEEAGAAPMPFGGEEDELDDSDLPADARVSLEDAAELSAPDAGELPGAVDAKDLLGTLLGGANEPVEQVKRPSRAPVGATPEELCDLALARALERLIKEDKVELEPVVFEALLEDLLKAVVAASSPLAALEGACEALMDSDHVEEVYGDDDEIIAELRRAFEEVRAEAQGG